MNFYVVFATSFKNISRRLLDRGYSDRPLEKIHGACGLDDIRYVYSDRMSPLTAENVVFEHVPARVN